MDLGDGPWDVQLYARHIPEPGCSATPLLTSGIYLGLLTTSQCNTAVDDLTSSYISSQLREYSRPSDIYFSSL